MKKILLSLSILLTANFAMAQTANTIYGIARQNYYSYVVNPFDSTIISQVYDSTSIRLGQYNTITGVVTPASATGFNDAINLTGAALNPYDNTYIFIGASKMNTLDLSTGQLINQATLSNPNGASYFDNFRFCNSDSAMYGLARRNYFDSTLMMTVGALYLAKANTNTGVITEISPSSVGQGFALAGSAIDPYQMVYYYSTGSNLIGLDMYNGSIYTNATIGTVTNQYFDNFTYSCADTALYGLVRTNHISYTPSPWVPGDSVAHVDSTTIKLGKINPSTGAVTIISPIAASKGGYVLNGGAAIDPFTMTYYYSDGTNMIGVSMVTGLVTSNLPFIFNGAQYFDMFRNFDNCKEAVAIRSNSATSVIENATAENSFQLFPNPAQEEINISSKLNLQSAAIFDITGKLQSAFTLTNKEKSTLNISHLSPGIYLVKVTTTENSTYTQKLIVE
jgi:Secretion system C-terminal sorting domain